MKQKKILVSSLSLVCAALSLSGCENENIQPLWEGKKDSASKTSLVISDLHLGVDSAFAENVANVPYLIQFLKRAKVTESLDEIVLAGDVLDGWSLPFSYGVIKDYLTFYQAAAKANQGVVEAINAIIKEARIKVVYVPGNHDVDLSYDIVASIFPNITQARDSEGVGTYRTGFRQEVAIEHGHRYNAFCAPDTLNDLSLRQGKTLIGPGYFILV
jgi:DNA repair exonuclease